MLKAQTRKRMKRQLGSKADLFYRVGQSAYDDSVGKICGLLTSVVKEKKEELQSSLKNDFGNEGVASSKPFFKDWVKHVVGQILHDGYQPILNAVLSNVIEPNENDLEEVNAMSRFKNLLAVACEASRRGEKEIGMQIFAEAMDSEDADESIEKLDLEVPQTQAEEEDDNDEAQAEGNEDVTTEDDKCESCGSVCESGANFCASCGTKIEKKAPVMAKSVITAEARKRIVAIANDIASRNGGKYKSIARELLQATRPAE